MDRQQQVRDFLETTAKAKGMSLNSLSIRLGKNSTYLFHFVKRHSPRRLDETVRRKLAQILDVNEQDLCDFQLPSNNIIQDKLSTISSFFNFGKTAPEELISIDIIDMEGPQKGRFETIKNNIVGQEFMTPDVLSLYTGTLPKYIKILKVTGESMAPTINSGDFIWLDTSYSTPAADGIYLLNTNSDCILRRLQTNPLDNSLEVSSDNKSYRSFTTNDYKKLNICGKVILITHKVI